MKTFNTFIENLDNIRQKMIDKKNQKADDQQVDLQRKAEEEERRKRDQDDYEKMATHVAKTTGDDIKKKLKKNYDIDVD